MSIRKTEFKLELILALCFLGLLTRAFPEVLTQLGTDKTSNNKEEHNIIEKKDEPGGGLLVVEYAFGDNVLLAREGGIFIPTPTPLPTMAPKETPVPTYAPPMEDTDTIRVADIIGKKYILEDLQDITYLKDNLYIVNASTKMTAEEFDAEYFISKDLSLDVQEATGMPQILIFHTHASEGFADSRPGEVSDTVVGAGEQLAKILREKYGYTVLHDDSVFDRKNGKDNRNYAYNDALMHLQEVLTEYPSLEVIIDLHRDAGAKRVTTINGKQTAKVMLFNGLCRNTKGKLTYLPNENLKDNLAFSFQMKLIGDEMYPGLMNRIFLKDYRYNMHLKERFLLVELGTEKNTVEEAMNAMEPLADVLRQVLGG